LWPLGWSQFWPQGHNLNTFGKGPLNDAIYQIAFWNPICWSCDLLMQPTDTVLTTLVGDHPDIFPVKFGKNPMSGFRGDL